MLSKNIETALNKQIRIEAESSQTYLSMACWAEVHGLEGIAQFMYTQSDEERAHMLKLIKYVNERGGHAQITDLKAPKTSYSTFKEMFEALYNHGSVPPPRIPFIPSSGIHPSVPSVPTSNPDASDANWRALPSARTHVRLRSLHLVR